jgi:trans-aconitate methyltransferase
MPVYGKGRHNRYSPSHLERKGFGKIIARSEPTKKLQHRSEIGEWKQFSSPLSRVSSNIGVNLPGWIQQHHVEAKRPLAVLDWGCGDGATIEEVARRFPTGVHAYGYDHHSHAPWLKSENVKYIHQDAAGMPRYIKKGSMDLIYSHYGLTHLLVEMPVQEGIRYLSGLVAKLKPGGLFAMNIDNGHLLEVVPMVRALAKLFKAQFRVEYLNNRTAIRPRYFVHIVRLK